MGDDDESQWPEGHSLRVAIVDDEVSFAELLSMAIDSEPDLQVGAVAHTVAAGLDAVRDVEVDVLVLDIRLPDLDGITAVRAFQERRPDMRILLLTSHGDADTLLRSAESGAAGWMLKSASVTEILQAMRVVGHGGMLVSREALASVIRALREGDGDTSRGPAPLLTRRERDVLACLARGLNVSATARSLSISANTCRGYRKTLFQKLGVHSQLEAVVVAAELGLVDVGGLADPGAPPSSGRS